MSISSIQNRPLKVNYTVLESFDRDALIRGDKALLKACCSLDAKGIKESILDKANPNFIFEPTDEIVVALLRLTLELNENILDDLKLELKMLSVDELVEVESQVSTSSPELLNCLLSLQQKLKNGLEVLDQELFDYHIAYFNHQLSRLDNKNMSPLLIATIIQDCDLIEFLLDNGADIYTKGLDGEFLFQVDYDYGKKELAMVQCFLNRGIKIEQAFKYHDDMLLFLEQSLFSNEIESLTFIANNHANLKSLVLEKRVGEVEEISILSAFLAYKSLLPKDDMVIKKLELLKDQGLDFNVLLQGDKENLDRIRSKSTITI